MARVRLLCLPHAGSGASSYLSWGRRFPETIELRVAAPPGREHRAAEPGLRDMMAYVNALAETILNASPIPFVIFGHSLGAVAGFELTHRLIERGRAPLHLVVSARGYPSDLPAPEPMYALPDDQLIAMVRDQYGGFPPEIDEFPELVAAALAVLRLDLEMLETLRPRLTPPLSVPLSVFWSPEDRGFTPQEMMDWRRASAGPVEFTSFEGGHFYLFNHTDAVIARLSAIALARR